jgi:hypothetical protein
LALAALFSDITVEDQISYLNNFSAYGAHGAIISYIATEETNKIIGKHYFVRLEKLFLIDLNL